MALLLLFRGSVITFITRLKIRTEGTQCQKKISSPPFEGREASAVKLIIQAPNYENLGFRCQVSEMIELNTETLVNSDLPNGLVFQVCKQLCFSSH
jgi:hypothetical protein